MRRITGYTIVLHAADGASRARRQKRDCGRRGRRSRQRLGHGRLLTLGTHQKALLRSVTWQDLHFGKIVWGEWGDASVEARGPVKKLLQWAEQEMAAK